MARSLLVLYALIALGCTDSTDTGVDTGSSDTGCTTRPLALSHVAYDFSASGAWWSYNALVDGIAGALQLDIRQTDGDFLWEEVQPLANAARDDVCLSWDRWETVLPVVTDPDTQVDGTNTLFAADATTGATLTWALRLYDPGNVPVECWTWGVDTTAFVQDGCTPVVLK